MTRRSKPVIWGGQPRRVITIKLAIFLGIISFIYSLFYWENMFGKEVSAESLERPGHNHNATGQRLHSTEECSSKIEREIHSGKTSTARLIVSEHPRIWIKGRWDWNKNNVGSLAWRIVHGSGCREEAPDCDDEKHEFCFVSGLSDNRMYGEAKYSTYARRYLWTILAAEGLARRKEWRLPYSLPGTSGPAYDPKHTEDELLADARLKLLAFVDEWDGYVGAHTALHGAAGYDWLVDRKYSDGITPVLSDIDRRNIQNRLINLAEKMKSDCKGQGQLLGRADQIYKYFYPIIGMALYEPDGKGISPENNAKAKEYLDDFDIYWVGKILPAMNEQGGTGGWHGGLCYINGEYPAWGEGRSSKYDVLHYRVGPLLYAHYTSTGQSLEDSVYNTGFLKYAGEFWNYMIYPNNQYLKIGPQSTGRYNWIGPMFSHARRRFSNDPYNRWVAELIGWVRNTKAPSSYVNAGSYDYFDQLMWEEKWPSARSANKLGCGTRHFEKLGWIAMRSGFTSPDDLAALFICQRYHWSQLDPYAQNSFTLERKGKLIKEFEAPILIDGKEQRKLTSFPTVSQGVETYSHGSIYDVGPGIMAFEGKEKYDYMKGDATNAYDSKELSRFTRQIVWLKPNLFIIFDVVVGTSTDYVKSWRITPAAMPEDRGSNTYLINNGSSLLWMRTLLPRDPVVISRTVSRFEVKPKVTGVTDDFLHVLEVTDKGVAADKDHPDLIESQEGDKILGAYVPRRAIVIFSEDGKPIKRTKFSLKGTEAGKVLIVVDLLPSTAYTIINDSHEFRVVSSDQGVIFLEAAFSGSRSIALSKST